MSDLWSDDRVSPLLDELKALEELGGNAEAAMGDAKARIVKIKSETRVKDRHLWLLLWANGDRSVYNEYRSLRHEVKHREQQIAQLPQTRQTVLGELDQVIVDNFEQNNPAYRAIAIEQRELRRKRDVCNGALTFIRQTRENIMNVSASLHVTPKGKAAVAAAKRKPDDISTQLKAVREKIAGVNRIAGSRDLVSGGLVKKLNVTFLGTEFGPDKRKKQLDDAARTLNEVGRKVEANRGNFEKRLRDLEKNRAHMVMTEREHLLSTHGLA